MAPAAGEKFNEEKVKLLIASLAFKFGKDGKLPIDFNTMSSLSDGQFTASALEHSFRSVRAQATKLLIDSEYVDVSTIILSKGRAKVDDKGSPAKRKKQTGKDETAAADDDEEAPPAKRARSNSVKVPVVKDEDEVDDEADDYTDETAS